MDGFEGDVRLVMTDDGADIVVTGGLVEPCASVETAVILSLFGGGADDGGRRTWWGNGVAGTAVAERVKSGLLAELEGSPVTSARVALARKAAEDDLRWLVDEGLADSVFVEVRAVTRHRLSVAVDARKDGVTVVGAELFARKGGD